MRRFVPSPHPSRLALVATALIAAAALAGCGAAAPVHMPGRVVRLTLDEYRILPQRVTVAAGTVRVIATNRGRLTHNVVIQSTAVAADGARRVLGQTPTAFPGQTVTTTVALAPGTYRMVSSIANQKDLGMRGTIQARTPR